MDAQTTALSALLTSLVFFASPTTPKPVESEAVRAVESLRQSTVKILETLERLEDERSTNPSNSVKELHR
jgi:hypothetical protein